MKNVKSIFAALIAIMFLTNSAIEKNISYSNAINSEEVQDNTKTFQAKTGGTVMMNISPGNISVNTWEKNEITLKVDGLEPEDWENLSFEESGSRLLIKFKSENNWNGKANFHLTVPKSYHLDITTTGGNISLNNDIQGIVKLSSMGGNISTNMVIGQLAVNTMGGHIQVGDVNGKVGLNTQGGNITAGNLNGEGASVSTMGGNIEIGNVSSSVDIKTYGGNIVVGNVGQNLNANTYGGNIWAKKVDGNAQLNTYGGNLELLGANGQVKAETMGGDISLKNITGSVDVASRAGDIRVNLLPKGKGSIIHADNGDIILELSSNSNAEIDAKVSGWGKHSDYEISSDFSNVPEKEKHYVYKLNGGGPTVTLKANNGDIKIKRAK